MKLVVKNCDLYDISQKLKIDHEHVTEVRVHYD